MKPYPSRELPSKQLHFLHENFQTLLAFQAKYFHLRHWDLEVKTPYVLYPAISAFELRDTFGSEGWTVAETYFWKEVDGVQVRCLLPVHSKHS